jgi:hypothetical protein
MLHNIDEKNKGSPIYLGGSMFSTMDLILLERG